LFQAGEIERKTAGIRLSSGTYHATPKPSPFRGSVRSWEWKLWWMIELTGLVISVSRVIGGPR
jgi:hypothetical protein